MTSNDKVINGPLCPFFCLKKADCRHSVVPFYSICILDHVYSLLSQVQPRFASLKSSNDKGDQKTAVLANVVRRQPGSGSDLKVGKTQKSSIKGTPLLFLVSYIASSISRRLTPIGTLRSL